MDETGIAIGIAEGEVAITATVGTIVGNAQLTVAAANVSSAFITKWDTTLDLGTHISLPFRGEVDVIVDWGDGTPKEHFTQSPFMIMR